MKRSGIIYPDPQKSKSEEVLPSNGKDAGVDNSLVKNINQFTPFEESRFGFKNKDEKAEKTQDMPADENSFTNNTSRINNKKPTVPELYRSGINKAYNNSSDYQALSSSNFNNDVAVKLAREKTHTAPVSENLFEPQTDKPRKFSSLQDFAAIDQDRKTANISTDNFISVRRVGSRNVASGKANNGNDKKNEHVNSTTSINQFTDSKNKTKLIREKITKVISRTSSDNETKGYKEKKENGKRESIFLNLMYIFEIFNWFSGSDIIIRIIIGAVAGAVGFGFIFTQMGLLSDL